MAITQNIYTGNGSTVLFNFTFEYLETTDVIVEVNDVLTTAYTFANATTIQLNTAPANGARIRIYRKTDTENPKATFFSGSAIRAQDLNNNATQSLYSVQEWQDQTVPKYNAVMPDDLDLGTYRIKNLGEPTLAQDAATKNYVDTTTVASAGDTMTGVLAMGTNKITGLGNPTNAQDAATKTYVDTTTVASAGDSMTGPLAMGASKITGLGDPTSAQDAATKTYVDSTTWNNTTETIDSTETWVSTDAVIGTTGATTTEMDVRHDTLVQTSTPSGSGWRLGKTWLQNDANKTLSVWNGSAWLGVASGGTFTTQPTVIYVDATNGNDADDGHRIINPKKTIKAAVAAAAAGDIIKVAPGVYQEILPIDITVTNLSIVGEAQRSCFIHPTVATEQQSMFRCNSGTYLDGFTFAGLKASGTRGGHYVDTDATYGLPTNQGWVASFYPGCTITKSPYINNCTNFADSGIDNSNFNPNNHGGTGGDTTSAPTGGGILVDGSVPNVNSPLRSFVINEFTQINLDGPGLLVCNNGYVQAVSFFGIFCHYHAKALSGGQINMEVGTTNFGRYGLIADGKSSTAIFTATANGAASTNATTFAINAPTAAGSWFGDATRPALNMLVQVGGNIYPILSATANGAGWNVVISRPNPSNRAENLGLINGHSNGAAVSFFLRSMISTASHTHEYTGAGTSYLAMPENGGVPIEANESINLNNGRVWLSSVDQNGKFKVGDTFVVDQQTGFVTIDPNSYSTNLVSDLSPELGGDMDVLTRRIYSSLGNVAINDALEGISGSAATPSFTFTGDANTGWFRIGADQLGIATNGVLRFSLSTTGATVAFPVDVPLGTAAAPSLTFTGDLNTGVFSSGADVVDVTTGGTAKVRVDSTTAPLKEISSSVYYPVATQVDIGTDPNQVPLNGYLGTMAFQDSDGVNIGTASVNLGAVGTPSITFTGDLNTGLFSPGADTLALVTGGTQRATVDSSGRLLVGTSASTHQNAPVQIVAATTSLEHFAGSNSPGDGAYIFVSRSRGTAASRTGVQNNDNIARYAFYGYSGAASAFSAAAEISVWVDGEPDTAGDTTDMPGRLVFSTTADGSSTPTERMRINSASRTRFYGTRDLAIDCETSGSVSIFGLNPGGAGGALRLGCNTKTTDPTSGVSLNENATSFGSFSDERIKTGLVSISNGLEKVGTLRAVTGRYTHDPEETRRSFLIAQDVQQVLPEAVYAEADEMQTLNLRYTEVIPLLVAALKESKERIEQLESAVTALQSL